MSQKTDNNPPQREEYDPNNPRHQHRTITNEVLERDKSTGKPTREIKWVGDWNFSTKRKAKLLGCKPEDLTEEAFSVSFKYLTVPKTKPDGTTDYPEEDKRKALLAKLKEDCRQRR